MRKQVIAGAVVLAGLTVGLAASAPASAATTTACKAPSAASDLRLANVVSTVYTLPSGGRITVTPQTDPMTAGYAASRGTLTEVCMAVIPRRR